MDFLIKRHLIIGDVHGCLTELQDLLKKCQYSSITDEVILVGDLVNKGPDSIGTINYCFQMGFKSVLGNHDLSHLKDTSKSTKLQKILSKEVYDWYSQLPLYLEFDDFIVVHAGLRPKLDLINQNEEDLTSIRMVEVNDHMVPWYEQYNGIKIVYYGHWAYNGLNIQSKTRGLDSGCVYGKMLSAFIHEENKLFQQKAYKVYQKID